MRSACPARCFGCATAAFVVICLAAVRNFAEAPSTVPPEGLRENTPSAHALVNARIVVSGAKTVEKGTLVIRDGVIVAVGPADAVSAPADARVWDLSGRTVYPGLIDAYSEMSDGSGARGGTSAGSAGGAELLRPASGGAAHWNSRVTPQYRVDEQYRADSALNKTLRSQGVVARLVAPSRQIIKGSSAAVSTADGEGMRTILRPMVAMHVQLTPGGSFGTERAYPVSPMGAVALVRQTMLDARWYAGAWGAWQADSSLARPEKNDALEALGPVVNGAMPVVIDAGDEQYALRADRIAKEFKLNAMIRGSGQEYRRIEEIAATKRPIIVPLNFARPPNVASPEASMGYSLEDLMDWDLQPENPGRLAKAGVKIALSGHGLRDRSTFLSAVRKAVARGLSREAALMALTSTPAEMLGLSKMLGTIEAGKAASLVVTDGDLFDTKTKVIETWVDGVRHEVTAAAKADLRGTWALNLGDGVKPISIELSGEPTRLKGTLAASGATRPTTQPSSRSAATSRGSRNNSLANVVLSGAQISFTFKTDAPGLDGIVQVSATTSGDTWMGIAVRPDGSAVTLTATRTGPYRGEKKEDADDDPATKPAEGIASAPRRAEPPPGEREQPTTAVSTRPAVAGTQPVSPQLARQAERASTQPALYEPNYPLGAFGRAKVPEQPAAVLFKNATVWTNGAQGKMVNASVLVEKGKITGVYAADALPGNLPSNLTEIDCTGKHISAGIIDCHSHIATDGGVNEGSQSITCEVRIGDFIDNADINIYRQLAGGVTSAHVLHGSANTIGGQSQVIKLRWGAADEEMKFAEAPPTVKFALGENVKRSSSETSTRYPRTRMGVEQLVRDAFSAARDYRRQWDEYKASGGKGIPPRVDLELEALSEIVEGRRLIHCHSYRQDEILALIRTCEQFNVKVAVFQHVLEGYKVADAIARHGAAGSTFSDWWAYKFEVWDAIPYNGSLMHNAGVNVSFNSDDSELARRLNLEAAKAVKYGGVSEEEALKFVTLNPAKQLKVDSLVGSIEAGKHADLVVWNASPLSTYSRCEQTWIDGRRYFDREEDEQLRRKNTQMRAALIQKILGGSETMAEAGEREDRPRDIWRHDASCPACECGVHLR